MILTVESISGEYAVLRDENQEELFIALALLPLGVDIGSRLKCENMSFELL